MSKASSSDDKRLRREIANSNERRRMQSINAGFIGLRQLLPLSEGEKLSKAAILQLTAKYINVLGQEKSRLLQQNNKLKELLQQQQTSGSCSFPSGRPNATVSLADDPVATSSDTPVASLSSSKDCRPPVISSVTVTGVSNVAHEVTVGSDVSSLPVKSEQSVTSCVASVSDAAQMNLPLRKRKRTYSLSVEPSAPGSNNTPSKTTLDVESLLSVGACSRPADAVPGTSTDDGGDTDADGNSAAPSASTCRTLPRESATANDSDALADRFRFVPSAPLPSNYASVLEVSKSEPDPSQSQLPLGYPLASPVVLGSTAYGNAMLVSANSTAPRNLFASPPFRLDMITSMQPSTGVPLLLSASKQRFDGVSFGNVSLESAPGPSRQCESSTSITKKNLETIFEAIRHVEGDDLNLGESPSSVDRPRTTNTDTTPSSASTVLVPFATGPDVSQAQTAFFVCLSPASLALSPTHTSVANEFSKQSAAMQFNVNAALSTVMSPVNAAGSASRFTQRPVQIIGGNGEEPTVSSCYSSYSTLS